MANMITVNDDCTLLFVYGTLRNREKEFYENNKIDVLCNAAIKGTLYSVEDEYPCVELNGDTLIQGSILQLNNFKITIAGFDQYEELQSGLYTREMVKAANSAGEEFDVWVYIWGKNKLDAEPVQSGDWFEYSGALDKK